MNSLLPLVVALLFCGLGPIQGQSLSLDVDEPIERFDLPLAASQEILRYQIGPLAVGHTYDIDLPIGKSHELVVRNRAADQLSTFRWRGTVYMPYLEIELHPQQITADNDLRLTVADFTDIHQRQVAARRMGSIEVTATDDAITLVDAVFKNQSCFATSEQTFLGEFLLQPQPDGSIDTVSQLGTFANGSSSVSFEQGIILSTGRVSNAEGPNDNNFSTQDYGTSSLDADMQVLSGGNPVNDMAVLEFEFRPTSDEINFDYVFASEEYCEAFNDNNTDVFAFFISGPGINGPFTDDAENIAVLPDGTTTINVNTVNHVTNTQFFRNNIDPGFFLNCGLTNPVALDDIGYDGMTTVLTASSPVIPCETYKLRMVIADVGDGFFDSAVMLVNGSFAAGLVNPEPLGASLDSNTFVLDQTEGCTPFEIAFNRVDSTLLADSVVVSYSVSTASSAMNPDDFSINQDSIIIMPGQLADTLIFTTVLDNLPEGTEEIILQLQGTCNCDANQVILRINDSPELDLALSAPPPDCAGSSFELAPTVSGGVGVYTYLWEDSSVDSARMVTTVEGDNIYSVTVTDACGQQDSMSINLATPAITAELSGVYSLCDGPTVTVPVPLTGGFSYTVTVLEDGVPQDYPATGDTLFLMYSSPVSLELSAIMADGCPGTAMGTAEVTINSFAVDATLTDILCFGAATGAIDLNVNGDPSQFTYDWQDPSLMGFNPSGLTVGTYPVRILDAAGCFTDTSFTLTEPMTAVGIMADSSSDRSCLVDGYLNVTGSGGTGMLTYTWLDGPSGPERTGLSAGNFTAVATDQNGCTDSLDLSIVDTRTVVDAAISAPGNQLDCVTNMILLTSADNPGQGIEHSWTDDSGAEVGTNSTFNASQAGTYTHTATNLTNGCTATDQFVITQSGDLPQLSVDRTYELSCDSTSLDISVEVDNFNGPVDFNWTGPNGTMGMDATLSGVTAPGAYTVTAFRPDNMCSGMLTINVTQNIASPTATLTSDGDLNCRDTETFVRATANPNYIYSWTTANGSIVAGADAEAARVAAGTYSLMVTDQTNGCSDDFSVSVGTDLRTLSPNAGMDQLLPCNNPAFAINGTANPALAGTTFRWFDETGSILATTADYTPPGVGIYELEVTHPESFCTSSDFVEITSEGPFAARLDITPPPCRDVGGQLRLLSVEGGVGPYTIDPGVGVPDPADPDRFLDILPGNYTYTVTDVNGCSFQEQFEVSADGEFTGTTSPIRIRIGESAALGAVINRPDDQISSYNWTATESQQLSCTDCPNPTVISTTSFVASVAIVDTFGCTLELLQQVFVDARQVVYMPNAFSPRDGNGVNDNFTLYGNPNLIDAIEYLAIFDRWGNDVWTATELPINDASQGWDGTFAGKPLNPQVLVFTGRVRLFDGTYREVQGSLTLTN